MLRRVGLSLDEGTVIHRLDPRVKLFAVVAVSALSVLLSSLASILLLLALPVAVLVAARCLGRASILLLLFLAFSAAGMVVVYVTEIMSTLEFAKFFGRVFSVVCIGLAFSYSTSPSRFAKALEKLRFPRSVVFTLTLTLRFIPVFMDEARDLMDSLKVRGVDLGLKGILTSPRMVFRALVIPLMIRLTKTADDLASALEARGVGAPVKRTSLHELRFSRADVLFAALVLVSFVSLFLLDSSYFSWLDVALFWRFMI
ncbi:MAG: energy-coupling factor transporter transmembrane component T family protein [Candidatus Freyarchaeota archaeon]